MAPKKTLHADSQFLCLRCGTDSAGDATSRCPWRSSTVARAACAFSITTAGGMSVRSAPRTRRLTVTPSTRRSATTWPHAARTTATRRPVNASSALWVSFFLSPSFSNPDFHRLFCFSASWRRKRRRPVFSTVSDWTSFGSTCSIWCASWTTIYLRWVKKSNMRSTFLRGLSVPYSAKFFVLWKDFYQSSLSIDWLLV